MYRVIAAALLTVFLAACGQTGPLYLPKDDPHAAPAPDAAPPTVDDDAAAANDAAADSENNINAPAPEDHAEH